MSFGIALARLRRARSWSQEELANRAGLSQRHVSFLETGRSQPGQAALAKLTAAMALKGWEQRSLMRSLTGESGRGHEEPKDVVLPVGFLDRFSKWPTCTFRPDGSLIECNSALSALLNFASGGADLWAETAFEGAPNLYDLTFHPNGLIQWMANPEIVIPETLRRLRIESSRNGSLIGPFSRFEAYPCVERWGCGLSDPPPLLEEAYHMPDGQTLRIISTLSSIASPGEVDLASLRIETFVPADDASEGLLNSLADQATLRAT